MVYFLFPGVFSSTETARPARPSRDRLIHSAGLPLSPVRGTGLGVSVGVTVPCADSSSRTVCHATSEERKSDSGATVLPEQQLSPEKHLQRIIEIIRAVKIVVREI